MFVCFFYVLAATLLRTHALDTGNDPDTIVAAAKLIRTTATLFEPGLSAGYCQAWTLRIVLNGGAGTYFLGSVFLHVFVVRHCVVLLLALIMNFIALPLFFCLFSVLHFVELLMSFTEQFEAARGALCSRDVQNSSL